MRGGVTIVQADTDVNKNSLALFMKLGELSGVLWLFLAFCQRNRRNENLILGPRKINSFRSNSMKAFEYVARGEAKNYRAAVRAGGGR